MKHLVLLLIVALAVYGLWAITPRGSRTRFKKSVRKHVRPVAAIVLILFAGLVYAFYTRSINLL